MWQLCGAGRFSYSESPRTPPLEGTSLHRRYNYECGETLGDLEPVDDLFSITSEFGLPEAVTLCETRPAENVVILTVNHRGHLTSRKHDFGAVSYTHLTLPTRRTV